MKIVAAILKYDYGKKERGESGEKTFFLPAMQKLGQEVIPFWLEENGFPENSIKLQENLVNFVDEKKPEAVFFTLMKYEITPYTLERLSQKYITINWFCDDHWRFESFTRYVAPKLTYSITIDKYSLSKYKDIGCQNVILSQWAAFHYAENMDSNKVKYRYNISFVGSRNPAREWVISELRKSGYKVDCFGTGWENGRVSFDQMKDIFSSSKLNLNLSNSVPSDLGFALYIVKSVLFSLFSLNIKKLKRSLAALKLLITGEKRIEQIKARNFEIPACGGFQLTQYALEIEDYYDIGREIAVFSNLSELKLQLRYFLENDFERNKVREAGYLKTKDYTYENRFKRIFERINYKSEKP